MSHVITFSTKFPSYHPRAGQGTNFTEKILEELAVPYKSENYLQTLLGLNTINLAKGKLSYEDICNFWKSLNDISEKKSHTIRAGKRFKQGDFFSPRIWFRTPYDSPQLIFWYDIQIKKTWDFDVQGTDFSLNGKFEYALTGEGFDFSLLEKNDGLGPTELFDWICDNPSYKKSKEFHGQILCWNENIEY